jgi:hypothetical protein
VQTRTDVAHPVVRGHPRRPEGVALREGNQPTGRAGPWTASIAAAIGSRVPPSPRGSGSRAFDRWPHPGARPGSITFRGTS